LWKLGSALHEQHHGVSGHGFFDPGLNVAHKSSLISWDNIVIIGKKPEHLLKPQEGGFSA
jgi:hypothetical protein